MDSPETEGITGVLGPYGGRLANEGEEVVLRAADGTFIDRVDYRVRFPWPLGSSGRGGSMELINPFLDNDLGGSWRASRPADIPVIERVQFIPVQTQSRQSLYDLELEAFLVTILGKKPPDRPLAHELLVQETLLRATGELPA